MASYVCAYDIAHDGRRLRVARILLSYGVRLQKSVFVLRLDADDLADVKRAVGPLLSKRDEFEIVPIDLNPQRAWVRWQRPIDGTQTVALY